MQLLMTYSYLHLPASRFLPNLLWIHLSLAATPHQNVGGVQDAITLQGQMLAQIQLPDDMWNADNELT
jgi:hypothetical protein